MRIRMPNSFFGPSNENPYAKLVFWAPLMRILMPNLFFRSCRYL